MRRPLFETLRDLRQGEATEEIEAKLQELVSAVQDTDKSGELVIKLKVAPMKGQHDGAVVVTDEVVLKKPEFKAGGTVMFMTPEGNLSKNHPRQRDLPGVTLVSDTPIAADPSARAAH